MLTNIWNIFKMLWVHGRNAVELIAKLKPILDEIDFGALKRILETVLKAIRGETVEPITADEEGTEKGRLLKRLFNRIGVQFACAGDPDYAEFVAWKTLRKREGGENA